MGSVLERVPSWARGRSGHRLLGGLVVVVLVVVLAVSCSGGASGTVDVPVQSGKPDAGVTGVRAPSTTTGGTLRVVSGPVDSLDPQRSYSPGVWNLMRLYVRTLVTYSSKPGKTGQLVPDLATDLGTTPDGGSTWTFTLKDGVAFAGGRPITSKDVKYGIERSFASDVVVGGPNYVVDLLDDPGNQYAGPYQDEAPDHLGLGSIETPDDKTLVFHLRTPQPDFPFVMALPSSSPVPVESDTGANYGTAPVSSGPYTITAVDATSIRLERNKDWKQATDDVRTALPDAVVVRTGLSGIERDQAVLAGSADVDITGAGVQPATTARLTQDDTDPPLSDRVDDVTTGAVRLLALPTDVAPFDNADCRAAVAQAVDRRSLQQAQGGAGAAVRSSVLWPRGLPGGPQDTDPAPDPAAARKSLEACGQAHGFSTVLAVADAPTSVGVAREVAHELSGIGIKVDVQALDPTTFYATDVGDPDNVKAKGYGIILATWTGDFPTPASFLVPLVDGRSIRTPGNTNYARLNDADINGLVDTARAAAGGNGALDAWGEVSTAAAKSAAYVPLSENRIQLIAGQRLRNGLVMQPYGGYDLATAGVR